MPKTNNNTSNCPNHETSVIWDEAGFIPPIFCRIIVEILHRLFNDGIENIYETDIITDHIHYEGDSAIGGYRKYFFTNRKRMILFAEEMNIITEKKSDIEIADKIISSLIGDYTGEKSVYTYRQDIVEVLNKIPRSFA